MWCGVGRAEFFGDDFAGLHWRKKRASQNASIVANRNIFSVNSLPAKDGGFMKRLLAGLLAFFVVGSALGQSPREVRITTWNLEWFPNGSAREAPPEKQAQRIQAAADVLKELNPDILLLQEVRDYDACNRPAEAIQPGALSRIARRSGVREELFQKKIHTATPKPTSSPANSDARLITEP